MPANTYGRQVVEALVNKSGGAVVAGDVVIIDTSNDTAFTTTTTAAYTGLVGVAQESIASNATGRVLTAGYAALVNVNASVTRGQFGKTHTVAKQATGASARAAGTFAQWLTGGTTPTAHLFGMADGTSAGGATGPSFGQAYAYPTSFSGDTIDGSSTTPFADVSAFSTKEVLNSRILHLQTLGASKDHRVRVTLGTTKAAAFDVRTAVAFSGLYWSSGFDTYLEVRGSTSADAQLFICRIGPTIDTGSYSGDKARLLATRWGGSSISAIEALGTFSVASAQTLTLRFVRDGSNVISFFAGAGTAPMALGPVVQASDDAPFLATVSGTLARIEYSIHTPSGPGSTAQWDAWVDYLQSV